MGFVRWRQHSLASGCKGYRTLEITSMQMVYSRVYLAHRCVPNGSVDMVWVAYDSFLTAFVMICREATSAVALKKVYTSSECRDHHYHNRRIGMFVASFDKAHRSTVFCAGSRDDCVDGYQNALQAVISIGQTPRSHAGKSTRIGSTIQSRQLCNCATPLTAINLLGCDCDIIIKMRP